MGAIYNCATQGVIQITRGGSYSLEIRVNAMDGTPFPFAGYTGVGQLRTFDGQKAINLDVSFPEDGLISAVVNADDLLTMPAATNNAPHVWGVRITDQTGFVQPEIQGGAIVGMNVVDV